MNDIKNLKPFTRFLMTIGELPSSYLISMTYDEQLLWFCNYLENTVIPTVNNNAEAVIELQNFIQNYFDNLDVQEEINNKLDEMAESGELTDIIAQYLQLAGVLAFNTVSELKNATNIVEGSICKTLGSVTYNDGLGAFYKIRTITAQDIVDENKIISLTISNTLIGEKIFSYDIELLKKEVNELKNDKLYKLNLMTNITYDFNKTYYTQGSVVKGNRLYVYKEYGDSNGSLLVFDYLNYHLSEEITVDLGHGADLTLIDNTIYACKAANTKTIISYNLDTEERTEIDLDITDPICIGIAKENDDNLLIIGGTGSNRSLSSCHLYRYNLTDETLTSLTLDVSKIYDTFYAFQSMEYRNGYLYILISSNDEIIKVKIEENTATAETIYNLPNIDNIGLEIGEYEGISNIDENRMMITTHILDDALTYRTLKTYIIDIDNNTPEFPKNYPTMYLQESSNNSYNIIVSNDNSSLLELGTTNCPFKTISRAINAIKHNYRNLNCKTIRIKNATNEDYNLYINTLDNFTGIILAEGSNVVFNFQRILNSNLELRGLDNSTHKIKIKNIAYNDKILFGTIVNSNIKIHKCNWDIQDGPVIYNSKIIAFDFSGEANNSDNYVFRSIYSSEFIDGIDWGSSITTTKKYHEMSGNSKIEKRNQVALNSATQLQWITDHVTFTGNSTSYCIIMPGKHTTS